MPRISYKDKYQIPEYAKKYFGDKALSIISVLGQVPDEETCRKLATGTPKQVTEILNKTFGAIEKKNRQADFYKKLSMEELENQWKDIDELYGPIVNDLDIFLEFCYLRGATPDRNIVPLVLDAKKKMTGFYEYCKNRLDNKTDDINASIAKDVYYSRALGSGNTQFAQIYTVDGKLIQIGDFASLGAELASGREVLIYYTDESKPHIIKLESMDIPPQIQDMPYDVEKYAKIQELRNKYLEDTSIARRKGISLKKPNQTQLERAENLMTRENELVNEQIELLKAKKIDIRTIQSDFQNISTSMNRIVLSNVMAVLGLNFSSDSFCLQLADMASEGKNLDEIKAAYPKQSEEYKDFIDILYSAAVIDKNSSEKNQKLAMEIARQAKTEEYNPEELKTQIETVGLKPNKLIGLAYVAKKQNLIENISKGVFETKKVSISLRWAEMLNYKPGISFERLTEISKNCNNDEYKRQLFKEIVNDIMSFPIEKLGKISGRDYAKNYAQYEYFRMISFDHSYLDDDSLKDTIKELFPTEQDLKDFKTIINLISAEMSSTQVLPSLMLNPFSQFVSFEDISFADANKMFTASSRPGFGLEKINMYLSDVSRYKGMKVPENKLEEAKAAFERLIKFRPLKRPELISDFKDEQLDIFEEATRKDALGFSKSNSPEYNAIKTEIELIKEARKNPEGLVPDKYNKLYKALKDYVFQRGPVPSTENGRQRFNAAMDLMYSLGLQLMDKAPIYKGEIERDFKIMTLRSNAFREKLLGNNSVPTLQKYANLVRQTYGVKDNSDKVIGSNGANAFLSKYEPRLNDIRNADLDARLEQNPEAMRRYQEYKAEREPYIEYVKNCPAFISDTDLKELALNEEFALTRAKSKEYTQRLDQSRKLVEKCSNLTGGKKARGLASQFRIGNTPEDKKFNTNLAEMIDCPEGRMMYSASIINDLSVKTDISKFYEEDVYEFARNAQNFGRNVELSFVIQSAGFETGPEYDLSPTMKEFYTYNNGFLESGGTVNGSILFYGGTGSLLFNQEIGAAELAAINKAHSDFNSAATNPKNEAERRDNAKYKNLEDLSQKVVDSLGGPTEHMDSLNTSKAAVELKEKKILSPDFRYLKAYAIVDGKKTRIKLHEAIEYYGIDKKSVSFEVMSEEEKKALDEAFLKPFVPREMPHPGALEGEKLVDECKEMLSYLDDVDDKDLDQPFYFLQIKNALEVGIQTGFKTREETRTSLRRIANLIDKYHKKIPTHKKESAELRKLQEQVLSDIFSRITRKTGLLAYQAHCEDINVEPVKYEYKKPFTILSEKAKATVRDLRINKKSAYLNFDQLIQKNPTVAIDLLVANVFDGYKQDLTEDEFVRATQIAFGKQSIMPQKQFLTGLAEICGENTKDEISFADTQKRKLTQQKAIEAYAKSIYRTHLYKPSNEQKTFLGGDARCTASFCFEPGNAKQQKEFMDAFCGEDVNERTRAVIEVFKRFQNIPELFNKKLSDEEMMEKFPDIYAFAQPLCTEMENFIRFARRKGVDFNNPELKALVEKTKENAKLIGPYYTYYDARMKELSNEYYPYGPERYKLPANLGSRDFPDDPNGLAIKRFMVAYDQVYKIQSVAEVYLSGLEKDKNLKVKSIHTLDGKEFGGDDIAELGNKILSNEPVVIYFEGKDEPYPVKINNGLPPESSPADIKLFKGVVPDAYIKKAELDVKLQYTSDPKKNIELVIERANLVNELIESEVLTENEAAITVTEQVLNPLRYNIARIVARQMLINEINYLHYDADERKRLIEDITQEQIDSKAEKLKEQNAFIQLTNPNTSLSGWDIEQLTGNDDFVAEFTQKYMQDSVVEKAKAKSSEAAKLLQEKLLLIKNGFNCTGEDSIGPNELISYLCFAVVYDDIANNPDNKTFQTVFGDINENKANRAYQAVHHTAKKVFEQIGVKQLTEFAENKDFAKLTINAFREKAAEMQKNLENPGEVGIKEGEKKHINKS